MEFKNRFYDLNQFKSLRYKDLKNQVELTNERIYEGLDFSNKTGFSDSLIGRALNGIWSFTGKNINMGVLKGLSHKLYDEYYDGMMKFLETKNIPSNVLFTPKTFEDLKTSADKMYEEIFKTFEQAKTNKFKIKTDENENATAIESLIKKIQECMYYYVSAIVKSKDEIIITEMKGKNDNLQKMLDELYALNIVKKDIFSIDDSETIEPETEASEVIYAYEKNKVELLNKLNAIKVENLKIVDYVYLLANKFFLLDEYNEILNELKKIQKNPKSFDINTKQDITTVLNEIQNEINSLADVLKKNKELITSYKGEVPNDEKINSIIDNNKSLKDLNIDSTMIKKHDELSENVINMYDIFKEIMKKITPTNESYQMLLEAVEYKGKKYNVGDLNEKNIRDLYAQNPDYKKLATQYVRKNSIVEIQLNAEQYYKILGEEEGKDRPGNRRVFAVQNVDKQKLEQYWKRLVAGVKSQFDNLMEVNLLDPFKLAKESGSLDITDYDNKNSNKPDYKGLKNIIGTKVNSAAVDDNKALNIVKGKPDNVGFGIMQFDYKFGTSNGVGTLVYESQSRTLFGHKVYRVVRSIEDFNGMIDSQNIKDAVEKSKQVDVNVEKFFGRTKDYTKYNGLTRVGIFLIKVDSKTIVVPDINDFQPNTFRLLFVYGSDKLFDMVKSADGTMTPKYNPSKIVDTDVKELDIISFEKTPEFKNSMINLSDKEYTTYYKTTLNVLNSFKIVNGSEYGLNNNQVPFNLFETDPILKTNLNK